MDRARGRRARRTFTRNDRRRSCDNCIRPHAVPGLRALFANWPKQPFIKTGYASPRLGEIFTIGRRLSEPFQGRLFFAGEHTQMDHFGYMEGALRSGERAAELLMYRACNLQPPAAGEPPVLVASTARRHAAELSC